MTELAATATERRLRAGDVEVLSRPGADPGSPVRRPGFGPTLLLLALCWVLLHLVGRVELAAWASSWTRLGAGVIALIALGGLAWSLRAWLFRTLTSLPFAVGICAALALATVLGTLIVQAAHPAEYTERYGTAFAPLIQATGLHDIFRASWFNGFLGLLAVSLALVIVKNRAWRMTHWGHLLAHGGVILVLIGGAIGNVYGFRGFIDLHEGRQAGDAVSMDRGMRLQERHPLGFSIRLDRFEIDRYEREHRLYVYERHGDSFRLVRSLGLEDARGFTRVGGGDAAVRVVRAFPDFDVHTELKEVPAGEGSPALRIELSDPEADTVHLLAGVSGRDAVDLAQAGGPVLGLVWSEPKADEVAGWPYKRSESHVVTFHPGHGHPEEVRVEPGEEYVLGDGRYRMRVEGYFPDFAYDTDGRRAFSRSDEPRNPALQVTLAEGNPGAATERFLIARAPDYGREHGRDASGPRLVYKHMPAREPAARELLVVGETREVWEIERGRVLARRALPLEGEAVASAAGARLTLVPSAEETHEPVSRSEEWSHPVVEVELRSGGATQTYYMASEHAGPLHLPDGETVLTFAEKPNSVQAFRSDLVVIEDGEEVARKTISVNDPLYHRGYHFYQSSYRESDPTYSGILVVKDPGLDVVWVGFLLMSLGFIFVYYIRPRILRRAAA